MNVGIVSNINKDKNLELTKSVIAWFENKKINVIYDELICAELSITEAKYCNNDIFKKSDLIVVLGGDGTFLNVARQASCNQVPLFGVNLGHLGFLTEIEVSNMYPAFLKLINGDYRIEERIMLEAYVRE